MQQGNFIDVSLARHVLGTCMYICVCVCVCVTLWLLFRRQWHLPFTLIQVNIWWRVQVLENQELACVNEVSNKYIQFLI